MSNPTVPIRFAVIGCGMLARSQHIPNIAKSERTVLHTCCDLDEAALAECQQKFGVKHITNDFHQAVTDPNVDAICLATTEKLRLPVIEAAAKAGKPIYVEKPLAVTLEEVYRIRDVVKQSNIPFCVGHNRRFSPAMVEAHQIFRQHMRAPRLCPWRFNREGDARPELEDDGRASISVRVNDDWHSWKAWVFDPKQAPHGPMLFEMTHFTDVCNWFMDSDPMAVMAMEQGMLNHSIIIHYRTGEMATIVMCANGTFGYPKELYEVMGHGVMVAIDHMVEVRTAGIVGEPAVRTYPMLNDRHPEVGHEGGIRGWLAKKEAACAEAVKQNDPMLQFTAEPDKGHAHAIERFVDQIIGEGSAVCGIDEAVAATRVAFAAVTSAREKRRVQLDEI